MKRILTVVCLMAAIATVAAPMRSMMGARSIAIQETEKEPPYPLPDGVIAVEYLASTNANLARINTGIKMTATMGFHIRYGSVRVSSTAYKQIGACGGVAWSGSAFFLQPIWGNNGQTRLCIIRYKRYDSGIQINYGVKPLGYLDMHEVLADPELGIWVDGEEKLTGAFETVGAQNRYPYCNLFCTGGEQSAAQIYSVYGLNGTYDTNLRIYRFRLFDNGNNIIDLVPVREGSVGKFYDLISQRFYENSGRGSFILGPDL